jgi:hypothetical protein
MGKTVIRNIPKILGTFSSGAGDNLLTINATTKEVTSIPSIPTGLSNALTSGHIFVGNASNIATDVAVTGMVSITNAGVASIVSNSIQNVHINASAAIAVSKLAAGSNGQVLSVSGGIPTWINSSSGTVTTISSGNLSPLFTTSITNPTTTPSISFALTNALQNTVLAGPTSGGSGAPAYRGIIDADIASLSWFKITATPTTIAGYGLIDAQQTLVSGTNIKTINGSSILGSGNLVITAGITNSAVANELMKSDGTNATPSGIFATTNGSPILGSGSIAGDRTITAASSSANSSLTLIGQGTGSIFGTANGATNNLLYFEYITEPTTSRTITEADRGKVILCTSASTTTVTLANGLSTGLPVIVVKAGVGDVNVVATGTLNIPGGGSASLTTQYASGTFYHLGSNVWNGNGLFGAGVSGAALTKTDDTNVTLTLGGSPSTALLNAASITVGWTGILSAARGGTANGFTAFTGPATSTKTFTLPNASAKILTDNVAVFASEGGTGMTTYNVGDMLYAPLSNVLGPLPIGVTGSILKVSGSTPGWGALDLANVNSILSTSVLPVANGSTGQSSYAVGDILYASGATTLSKLADVAAGSYLRSGGVTTAPLWSTLTLPNAATANQLAFASGTNALGFSSGMTYNGSTLAITGSITGTNTISANISGSNANSFNANRTGTLTASALTVGFASIGNFNIRATASDVVYGMRVNNGITTGANTQEINGFYGDPSAVINNTGAILRGFYWNPSLSGTQVGTLTHYGLVIGSGTSIFGGTTATAGSVLADFQSTTQGILVPRMTNTQLGAIATPVAGMVVYDSTNNKFNFRENTSWVTIGSGGIGGSTGATDKRILIANGTGGATLQASGLGISSNSLVDSNGNELINFSSAGSAVNEFTIQNNVTTSSPILSVSGGDTNIDMGLKTKGAGVFSFSNGSTAVASLADSIFSLFNSTSTVTGPGVMKFEGTSAVHLQTVINDPLSGSIFIHTGNGANLGPSSSGDVLIYTGSPTGAGAYGNIALHSSTGSFGSGQRITYIGNRITAPSTNPADGFILYSEDLSSSAKPKIRDEAGNDGYIPVVLYGSATLDFPNTVASSSSDLTITVTGAAVGDLAVVTPPNGSVINNTIYTCWVSATNTVTVRFSNLDLTTPANPASGTFKALVFKNS